MSKEKFHVFVKGLSDKGLRGTYGILMVTGKKEKLESISNVFEKENANRVEIRSLIDSLHQIPVGSRIRFYTDNAYIDQAADVYLDKWIEKGKLDKRKHPDLWRLYYSARKEHLDGGSEIDFKQVTKHESLRQEKDGIIRAKALAMEARKKGIPEISQPVSNEEFLDSI